MFSIPTFLLLGWKQDNSMTSNLTLAAGKWKANLHTVRVLCTALA
jgi:hypothetical protein